MASVARETGEGGNCCCCLTSLKFKGSKRFMWPCYSSTARGYHRDGWRVLERQPTRWCHIAWVWREAAPPALCMHSAFAGIGELACRLHCHLCQNVSTVACTCLLSNADYPRFSSAAESDACACHSVHARCPLAAGKFDTATLMDVTARCILRHSSTF